MFLASTYSSCIFRFFLLMFQGRVLFKVLFSLSCWSYFYHLTLLTFTVFASICLEILFRQISGRLHETTDLFNLLLPGFEVSSLRHVNDKSWNLNYFPMSVVDRVRSIHWCCIGISKDMFLKSLFIHIHFATVACGYVHIGKEVDDCTSRLGKPLLLWILENKSKNCLSLSSTLY